MRVSSFKAQYRQAPPRSGTPPPPTYEPLSPVLRPSETPTTNPAGSNTKNREHGSNGINGALHHASVYGEVGRAQLHRTSPSATYDPPLRSAPLPRQKPQYSPALGSPIDALANAAVSSLHASPAFLDSSRRPSYGLISPATAVPLPPPNKRAPKHAYPDDTIQPYDERPSKRARSEVVPSPQYGYQFSRPATSHIPGWSYNVEQMVDNGIRMYQDSGAPAAPTYHQEESTLKRLSDAQLLLDFHHAVSVSHGQPPILTAKRWPQPDVPAPYTLKTADASSPRVELLPSKANLANTQEDQSSPTLYHGIHQETRYPNVPRSEYTQPPSDYNYAPEAEASTSFDNDRIVPAAQTHTPPEETLSATLPTPIQDVNNVEGKKAKKHQGWPKGKPRGPRTGLVGSKKKRSTPKPKSAPSTVTYGVPNQLHSPQSLPAERHEIVQAEDGDRVSVHEPLSYELASHTRRHSCSNTTMSALQSPDTSTAFIRARSVPLDASMIITPPSDEAGQASDNINNPATQITVCAGCHSSDSHTLIGEGEQWISCDGCKQWYHFVCAGFKSEREVRDVDKYYCLPCSPKFGHTTKVRKSGRAHTAVDYAGLNEGILKTSDDNPEHHYIAAFKNGGLDFTTESFARLPPELITAEFFEKSNGFKEPVVIPGALNPRPKFPGRDYTISGSSNIKPSDSSDLNEEYYEYEMVPDDGQDKMDMVIPHGLTVRRVSELYGPTERVPVIDVKAQEGEDKRWTMAKWADYYEQEGEKPVRNVISLEVSRSRLGKLIRRPKAVRDMDLQDSVWPEDDKMAPPPVQFYCLMSVADCYTDFHIDFGGSSVYYHIIKGKKTFFFIPPTKQNLKKYEDWCLSPKMGHEFLGQQVKECYRVDLFPGDTMLIPSGWIHAVWTPEDSLVIGGNFLTRIHYGMQIKVLEIEKNTKVAPKFRYPYFQKIMWLVLIKYIEDDRLPPSVEKLLLDGGQFHRSIPIYCETDKFGHNSHLGPENYNSRYYSKAELDGLPDLANYIWRTVMISLGRIEGVTQTVRNAVTRSIPKGHGEPIALARRFAMWIAWKKGNESIPQWAHPDASLPETADSNGDKNPSATQAPRAVGERQSMRIRDAEPSPPNGVESPVHSVPALPMSSMTGFLRPAADPSRHMSTPKTSQLGPKRIACDACRKRRIRCKHKDEIIETPKSANGSSNGTVAALDLSGSLPISVKRRESDTSFSPLLNMPKPPDTPLNMNGPVSNDLNHEALALKSGRVKACADCRKSKRRCIHDEFGNVDPVKASETPIPRGSASKKRRVSEEDSESVNRNLKSDPISDYGMTNGETYPRNPLQTPSHAGRSSEVQDTTVVYSPQKPADRASSENMMAIDPALESYDAGSDTIVVGTPSHPPHRDTVLSSIENLLDDSMEGVVETGPHGFQILTIHPRTPGPAHGEPDGIKPGPLSPVSPLAQGSSPENSHITVLPVTPNIPRSSRVSSSSRKINQTPRSTHGKSNTPKSTPGSKARRDSKESIKMEPKTEQATRAMSSTAGDDSEDMASLALALQLQMEEHGLRRRSK